MRKIWTFFYGSFMNSDVLAKADVHPTRRQMARLDGWELKIAPHATLIPAQGESVFGILAQLTHSDIDKLYTRDCWKICPDRLGSGVRTNRRASAMIRIITNSRAFLGIRVLRVSMLSLRVVTRLNMI